MVEKGLLVKQVVKKLNTNWREVARGSRVQNVSDARKIICYLLNTYYGMSYKEIGDHLKIVVASVRYNINHAPAILKKRKLTEWLDELTKDDELPTPKFAVGQKWRNKGGDRCEILTITEEGMEVRASDGIGESYHILTHEGGPTEGLVSAVWLVERIR